MACDQGRQGVDQGRRNVVPHAFQHLEPGPFYMPGRVYATFHGHQGVVTAVDDQCRLVDRCEPLHSAAICDDCRHVAKESLRIEAPRQ